MSRMTHTFRENLRIIWAITAKDILEAIKNKTTLSVILTSLFMVICYRMLPTLESGNLPPRLAVYDAGKSHIVEQLEEATQFDLVEVSSEEGMKQYVADKDIVILGLSLPADLDQMVEDGNPIVLEGYVAHWVRQAAVMETQAFFQDQLNTLTGVSFEIDTDDHIVYSYKDSRGLAFLASAGLIIALVMAGLMLTPHLIMEERQTKTIDALLVSPANSGQLVIGKAIAGLFYCLVAAAIAMIFNMDLITQWGLAILAVICGSLFVVALGLLIGTTTQVKQQLTIWFLVLNTLLLLPLFLSISKGLVPEWVIAISNWIPTVALSRVLRLSYSNHAPLAAFVPELVFVMGCTMVVLVIVTWFVRRETL